MSSSLDFFTVAFIVRRSILPFLMAFLLIGIQPQSLRCFGNEVPQPPVVAPNGPLIELHTQSGQPYTCYLLKYKENSVSIQMLSGETKSEKISDVTSIRFIPPPRPPEDKIEKHDSDKIAIQPFDDMPPEPSTEPGLTESKNKVDGEHGSWTPEENRRFRDLSIKSQKGPLSPEEVDERRNLLEHAPEFRQKYHRTLDRLQEAHKKGEFDNFINKNRENLKKIQSEEEAKDVLLSLALAYRMKKIPRLDALDILRHDIMNIPNEKFRGRTVDIMAEILGGVYGDKPRFNKGPKP